MSAAPSLHAPEHTARRRRRPASHGRATAAARLGRWTLLLCAALLVLAGLFPDLVAPGDPLAVDPSRAFRSPGWGHPFGTDESGRDVFTRVVHGAGPSLFIGVTATVLGVGLGAVLGLVTGLGGRRVDAAGSRLVDAMLAFPTLLLALLVIAVRGPGVAGVVVAVGLSSAPGYARLLRSEVRRVARSGHVEAARMLGHSPARIVVQHVLPGALGPLLAVATLGIGQAIVWASALGYLGLGAPPPEPEWGAMLNAGRTYITNAWWMTVFPGLATVAVGVVATLLGRRTSARLAGRRASDG
ncbi:ABC transporter permease [Kocuria varians]|uniref:ABC transporter permease n=1 Tax=Kocuria varians TaxID=1272 RepID=A0A4Y4D7F6_KOCVA|nr:ABC transporter permease [Kocuria varians]GEC99899.1 ABC transporter permease [Kocuria varians]